LPAEVLAIYFLSSNALDKTAHQSNINQESRHHFEWQPPAQAMLLALGSQSELGQL
jgi:hypothetical protein